MALEAENSSRASTGSDRPEVEVRALRDCDREGSAQLYTYLQERGEGNPLFRQLKCSRSNILEYGRILYDHCAKYESRGAVDKKTNEVIGLFMVMEADELFRVPVKEALGPCRIHLALMKHLQKLVVDKYAAYHPKTGVPDAFLYGVYCGVAEACEGQGVFMEMTRDSYGASYRNRGSSVGWIVMLNQDFVVDQLKSKSANTKPELEDTRRKQPLVTACYDLVTTPLQYAVMHGPAWFQRHFLEAANLANLRGDGHVQLAYDTRAFRYQGRYPFKEYLIAWTCTNAVARYGKRDPRHEVPGDEAVKPLGAPPPELKGKL